MTAEALVIHPGPLGDVLLATPALRALRRRHAGERLVLAAQPAIGELMHRLGVVDAHLRFDALGLDTLFVEGPSDVRTQVLANASRVVCWFGANDAAFAERVRTRAPGAIVAPPWIREGLVWEHLLATIGASVACEDREPVRPPSRLAAEGRVALAGAGWNESTPLVILHPGGGGASKRWPVEGFAEVLGRLETAVTVMVHEGPSDAGPVRALVARLDPRVRVLENPTLPVLAAALAHARAFLGNDSGVSHLSAAVGARSVVLITSGLRAWAPWSPRAQAIVVSTARADRGDVDAVVAAIERALA